MYYVALLLMIIWGLTYMIIKKKLYSGKIYFILLFIMAIPGFFEPNFLNKFIESDIDYTNIFSLGILLILAFIPWYYFDKHIGRNIKFEINHNYIEYLKILFFLIIIGSLFSIIYLLPYAVQGVITGALEMRENIQEESPLPESIFTTIAVGFANLHIFAILFFYISFLSNELKRYRFWLIIASMSYICSCMAITARDGFIILPLFFIIFYIIFSGSLAANDKKKIKRILWGLGIIIVIFISSFTISRFWAAEHNSELLQEGTIGYIAQQPYVFDSTIQDQTDFHGWELRFPLINRLMGIENYEVYRLDTWYETSFGTMFADFYNIGGWGSIIGVLSVLVLYYWWALSFCYRNNKLFGMFLIFSVYAYIVLTGLFYCRAGSSVSMNIFYITISILPLFMGEYLTITKQSNVNNRYSYNRF